ncbi:MAG: TonB-dependent receptor [Nitrospira sp.]|nr:TonB-dependent receptor [Nitrospira sp.]
MISNAKLQPLRQSPSNVFVVTAEEIRQSGATDLPTILRRVPGLSVIQLSGFEFAVSARGDNQTFANKLLLMIDGRSVYEDTQGNINWLLLPISFSEIKRIEVLKGPAAAIYGFNAFDGVVNIVTKDPDEMKGTTIQAGAGEFGTVRSSAVHANRLNQIGYRLSIGHDQNQQWRNRDALSYRSDRVNGLIDYHATDQLRIRLEGGLLHANPTDIVSSDIIRVSSQPTNSYARVAAEHPDFFIRASWSQLNQGITNTPLPFLAPIVNVTDMEGRSSGIPFLTNSYDLWSQYMLRIGNSHSVIGGINYRRNTLSSSEIAGFGQEDRLGLYMQDAWTLWPSLTLNAGVRMDLHSDIHPTYSPRVALIYEPITNHTFRISSSMAYRPPTLVESNSAINTNFTFSGFGLQSQLHGSHNLDPERIVSYEGEYQGWWLDHRLRTRVAVFHNHLKNLINAVPISLTSSTWANTPGVADIQGVEVGVEVIATSWLRGFANYSNQHTNQSITGHQRRGGPTSMASGGLVAEWENGLMGQITAHYVGAGVYPVRPEFSQFASIGLIPQSAVPNPRVGSYTLLNVRAGYRFWQNRAEIAVAALNALNDQHREHPLGDILSSRVMGWFTLAL